VRRRWTHVDHLPLAELYRWLGEQHARGENTNLYDPAIKRLLKSYKLPFKNMPVPPAPENLFEWVKGARRLSNWIHDCQAQMGDEYRKAMAALRRGKMMQDDLQGVDHD
jgi:hypothetical protein